MQQNQKLCVDTVTSQTDSFFVVGLGASAGGLRPLEEFFAHMPHDSGAAFVIVQHLSPDYKSLMNELLGRCTRMTIRRIEAGMLLQPNTIYLIPPGQNLLIQSGQFQLIEQERLHHSPPNLPIDLFFDSLAQDVGERAIAIILSGTGRDGSRGIQRIHEAGGIILTQNPVTAEFDGMPYSAIATGLVDRSFAPAELAQLVYQLVRSPSDREALNGPHDFAQIQDNHLQQILRLLAIHENIDFSQYKTSTLSRRIQRRCMLSGFQNLNGYLHALNTSTEERQKLRSDLLISVTCFFRDPAAWAVLATEILPPLVTAMSLQEPLRIWVTACATGEEAYSIAILVDELAAAQGKPVHAKIFATDLDHHALEFAAQGCFPLAIANDVSAKRLQCYFNRKGDTFEVVRSIREMIVFAPHNLVRDSSFSRIHLVCCRNVLIYMEIPLQQQVLRNLHFALMPHGVLFLGESESLGELENEFTPCNRRSKIYQKRRNIRLLNELLNQNALAISQVAKKLPSAMPSPARNLGGDMRLNEAFRLVTEDQQNCCLILNEQGHVLHVYGATPELLPPPQGPVSNEAIKMVAPALQLPLSAALTHARKSQGFVHYSAVELLKQRENAEPHRVSLRVSFHQGDRLVNDFFIVFIQPDQVNSAQIESLTSDDLEQANLQRVLTLENELQRTRESLQATIEELETTNEEQQATNEELIASNEELQSTNEELQSVNEELYTVNAEYQSKIQELTQLNNDMDNLLQSADIGVIFLDRELCVRKFTPAATQVVSLVPSDVDRPLHHLVHNLEDARFYDQLRVALVNGQVIDQEVKLKDADRYLLMRISPYRINDQAVDGLVLTLVDITVIKQAQQALEENMALLETVINATPDPVFVKNADGCYELVNQAALKTLNRPLEEVIGQTDLALFAAPVARKIMADDQQVQSQGQSITYEECLTTPAGDELYLLTTKAVAKDTNGKAQRLVGFARNITRLKQAQNALEQSNQKLHQEIEQRQVALQALQESESRFRNTFEQAAVGIAHVAPDGTLVRLNQRFADIVGYTKEELCNRTFQEITHPDDLEADLNYVKQTLAGEIPTYTMAKRYFRKDQTIVWVELTVALIRTGAGDPRYFISVIQDITLQKKLETERDRILQELAHEKELAQVTLHSIGDAVITTDAKARVQYCNPIAESMIGCTSAEIQGQLIGEVVNLLEPETRQPIAHPVDAVLQRPTKPLTTEDMLLVSRDGQEFAVSKSVSPIQDRQDHLIGTVTVFRDTTEARQLSQQLSWQATHDPLTELINRRQFEQELIQIFSSVRLDDRQEHVLCYLDLDQFKVVNDTSGHLAGDELLRQVAMLLKTRVRGSDCLARLGGDEFGILLKACPLSRGEIVADELRAAIHAFRFVWQKRTFSIGVSIGLVAINHNIVDLPTAMSAADAACYAAKERGRNRVYVYQADDADVVRQRNEREWSVRIRHALEHNQFCLYQQQIVPVHPSEDETVTHCEILLRMLDDTGELIPPNAFIPAAERYDLMPQIDRWVLKKFLNHVTHQPSSDSDSVIYTVNLSGASLADDSFLEFLRAQLRNCPSIAQRLCFEITETAAISNLTEAVDFINAIQKLGCQFSLDDFGSGMSSFGYLKALPVSYLKIDGKFVRQIHTDPTAEAIVESINSIGHVMGLKTIAEFVESEESLVCLRNIGVDYVQGYGVAEPQIFA